MINAGVAASPNPTSTAPSNAATVPGSAATAAPTAAKPIAPGSAKGRNRGRASTTSVNKLPTSVAAPAIVQVIATTETAAPDAASRAPANVA